MKFTHLHVHSHYSLLDGLSKIDELLNKCQELGMDSIALTDHGAMYGIVEFYQKAKARNIKPIIGLEVYLAIESRFLRRPHIDDQRYHLTLLAKNKTGYQNLIKLATSGYLEGFYYKPRIDKELLKKHSLGLIALSGCLEGEISKSLANKNFKKAEKAALEYQEIFGKENFYLEIMDHPNLPQINPDMIKLSKKHKIPLVATNDSHYLNPEDAEAQDILLCIQTNKKVDDKNRLTMADNDYSLRPPERMIKSFKDTPEAIENTQKIVEQCDFELELGKTKLPYFRVPKNYTLDSYLEKMSKAGIKKRYPKLMKKILDRLNYELKVIKETGFAPYFLIVQDFVNWAKNNNIVVGPGRGSCAGSIVSYALNITDVDPLEYGLLFERFLNPERISMPDIDLDFADHRRDEVIDYVRQKYGQDHVAQIITFGTMAARAAVRDAGRAMGLPYSFCDQTAKMVPMFSNLKNALSNVRELENLYYENKDAQKLLNMAQKLEGVVRHASTHACGVVITAEPIDNLVPRQHPNQDDKTIVTQYEMHSIEDLGLLKMDFLGLKNLTVIENTLNSIPGKINLAEISLADKKTFKLLQETKTVGVFQLECLSGDTIVSNTTIKKLYERRNKKRLVSIYLDEGKTHLNQIIDIWESGEKKVYSLIAENNWYIKTTRNHYFLTANGWKKLEEINPGDEVLIRNKAKHLVYNVCQKCGKQISGQKEGKSNFCYRCSAIFYRNPSKKESREKIRTSRIKFYRQGGKPWNFGVTTENNKIWKKTAEKISKALTGRNLEELWGKKRAQKFKKELSKRMAGKGNPMFGRLSPHRKGGFREDLGHYVRSSWEADFARILKLHNLDYEYEPKIFRLIKSNGEVMHYTPDFYVRSNNVFYEIKGWLHDLDKEKIELFQKQYPQYNFILISATKFAEFALKYKTLINWECPQIPKQGFRFIKVKEIKYAGREKTYDIKMQSPGNNFQANGFIVHNSAGMRRYLKQLKPSQIEDIIAMVALYRPGPMDLIPDFIAGKHGLKKINYLHPKLKPILKNTYGIAVYQEQVLQIARDLAGFTLGEADVLRKAVGKKIKELLDQQKDKFIQGCLKNKISENIAKKLFSFIEPFARYGFNKAHATCYAIIGFQTAYLKAHYPAQFMASLLTADQDNLDRVAIDIEECKNLGIIILPPDINESKQGFTVINNNNIRFGLNAIKNVGRNIVDEIVKKAPFKSLEDFIERVESKDLNKKSLEALIKTGALDQFGERNRLLHNLEQILIYARETQRAKIQGQSSLFANLKTCPQLKLKDVKPAFKKQRLIWEKELLGLYVSEHPLEEYNDYFNQRAIAVKDLSLSLIGQDIRIGGVINKIKKIITKAGQTMLFVGIEDLTGKIEVIVFPRILEQNPEIWQEDKLVLIKGVLNNRDGSLKMVCNGVEEVG